MILSNNLSSRSILKIRMNEEIKEPIIEHSAGHRPDSGKRENIVTVSIGAKIIIHPYEKDSFFDDTYYFDDKFICSRTEMLLRVHIPWKWK